MSWSPLAAAALCAVAIGIFVIGTEVSEVEYERGVSAASAAISNERAAGNPSVDVTPVPVADTRSVTAHVPKPDPLKAIYMSSCVAGTPSFRSDLVALIDSTEVNAVMIDIKDFSGTISFRPEHPEWLPAWESSRCGARDMKEFVASLHAQGIYVIGRITVFQDPFHAERAPHLAVKRRDGETIWRDGKGLAFIDVAAKEHWDHIIALSVDSYNLGFDELNYDYVRYPSDGNMQDISFPHTAGSQWPHDKQANLEAFFSYLHTAMGEPDRFASVRHENTGRATSTPYLSADLFGMTTTNYDDLSIGQILERAVPYFDAVAPMVYPSHYPDNYLGYPDPNLVPYEIVHHAMRSGVNRLAAPTTRVNGFLHTAVGTSSPGVYQKPIYPAAKLRTWIQDFDYGGDYDAADVRAQIQASYDAGVTSWMIWAPSNRYTAAALQAE